jgi:hypothetical protein
MLGWNISVYRQTDGGLSPASPASARGERLAVWQTGHDGLDWIGALVEEGKAIALGGYGYPSWYTATATCLIPGLGRRANEVWVTDPGDVVTEAWAGATVIDDAAVEACRPGEWLLVVAWDES